jgi:hypothetical protein
MQDEPYRTGQASLLEADPRRQTTARTIFRALGWFLIFCSAITSSIGTIFFINSDSDPHGYLVGFYAAFLTFVGLPLAVIGGCLAYFMRPLRIRE